MMNLTCSGETASKANMLEMHLLAFCTCASKINSLIYLEVKENFNDTCDCSAECNPQYASLLHMFTSISIIQFNIVSFRPIKVW